MITHEWCKSSEADAQRLAEAELPEAFWRRIAANIKGNTASPQRFTVAGDTLVVHPSYIQIVRDGQRRGSLGVGVMRRALHLHRLKTDPGYVPTDKFTPEGRRITWT